MQAELMVPLLLLEGLRSGQAHAYTESSVGWHALDNSNIRSQIKVAISEFISNRRISRSSQWQQALTDVVCAVDDILYAAASSREE